MHDWFLRQRSGSAESALSSGRRAMRLIGADRTTRLSDAGAAVAEVSRRLLAGGRTWCLLFADVENPTSTALYRRLGYQDICLYREYRFP